MFGNGNRNKSSVIEMPKSKSSMPSLIGGDISITGDLDGDSDVQIDGNVEGNVKCRGLTIGEGGSINGKVIADEVVISGTFSGEIKARNVSLLDSAQVQGAITVREALSIAEGANYEGQCKRVGANEKADQGKFDGSRKSSITSDASKISAMSSPQKAAVG